MEKYQKKYRHTFFRATFILLLLFSTSFLYSQSQDFYFWYWDVGTSTVVYGDDVVNDENKQVHSQNVGRFIITADLGMGIDLDDRVRLLTGGLVLADIATNADVNANRIDYGFFTGVRVYPDLLGFNFGVDYVLGSRTDFIKLPGDSSSKMSSTPWGNGFRINMGYDFSYNGHRFAPNVEGSYRMMPRGGSYDHYFSIFLNFNIFP